MIVIGMMRYKSCSDVLYKVLVSEAFSIGRM